MGEIIDFIVDFEQKLVLLLKDLWRSPADVVKAIVEKEKKYLSPFKFYSLVFSLWILLIQFSNPWIEALDTEPALPRYLAEFEGSYREALFLVAPFLFLVEWILIFGIINSIILRRPRLSLLNHIAIATYQGGMVLLILVPLVAITAIWALNFEVSFQSFGIILVQLLLLLGTLGFIVLFTWRAFQHKYWAAIKVTMTFASTTILAFSLIFDSSLHTLIYKKLFYSEGARYKVETSTDPMFKRHRTAQSNYVEKLDFLFSDVANTRIGYTYDNTGDSIQYSLERIVGADTNAMPFYRAYIFNHDYELSWHGAELNDSLTIAALSCDCEVSRNRTWTIGNEGHFPHLGGTNIPYVRPSSQFALLDGSLLFSGVDTLLHTPVISRLANHQAASEVIGAFPDKKNFQIDAWSLDPTTGWLQMLMYRNQRGRLMEIRLVSGSLSMNAFATQFELPLLSNELSPTLNFFGLPLHNSKVVRLDRANSVVVYQVMTDTTFVTRVHKIDIALGVELWQKTIHVPADFSCYHHAFVDRNKLIVLGQAASVFPTGWTTDTKVYNYVVIMDLDEGELLSHNFIESYDAIYDLTDIYARGPAYQDEQNIYWEMHSGEESLIIDKNELLRVGEVSPSL